MIHHRMKYVKEAAVTRIRAIRTCPRSIIPDSPMSGILIVRRRAASCSGVSMAVVGALEGLARTRKPPGGRNATVRGAVLRTEKYPADATLTSRRRWKRATLIAPL